MSVIVPTHRPNPYFEQTLASLRAQTYQPVETIVVDDGWTDRDRLSALVGPGPAVHVVRQAPSGIARARNRGLSVAAGRYVAFLDHDDLWQPDHLAVLVRAIRSSPTAVASFGRFDIIDGDGRRIEAGRVGPSDTRSVLSGGTRPSIISLLVDTTVLGTLGGFEVLVEPADDVDLILKLATTGELVFADRNTAGYRLHESNTSRDVAWTAAAAMRMLNLHLDAAEARHDHETAALLARNRGLARAYWAAELRRAAIGRIRSRQPSEARRLLTASWRLSRSELVRDIMRAVRQKAGGRRAT